jgi:putrescine aminotransferase
MGTSAFLHPFARPAADRSSFVTIVRGEGAIVFDDTGRRYVDAVASLWYCNVGHGRAEVADAVATQLRTLAAYSAFDRFTSEPAEELCAQLAGIAPVADARVFLTCDGSEAIDSAIKLARLAQVRQGRPGKTLVVSRTNGYHGVTYGGMTAQGLPANREGFGPFVEGVVHVDHADLAEAEKLFADRGEEVALVIAEPVQGAGGVHPPAPGYLEGLRRLCDDHGAFLCFDEVICGFGRLGAWWGADRYGVRPDLVAFAKGVTSGYVPLGGVLVGGDVRAPLESDADFVLRHGHTYSGHAGACAAALACLDITRRESLLDRALAVGARLSAGLRALHGDGLVTEVRGDGAVWAVGLHPGTVPTAVRDRMQERGVIVRPLGESTVAFSPPLVIGDDDVDHVVDALRASLAG